MATPAAIPQLAASSKQAQASRVKIPWTICCGAVAVTSSSIGGAWDVSWHRSIGRDTFWTPAHMAIYACGVLAAIICGYLILSTTFGSSAQMKAESVNVFGLRAPLGAFIAAWGGIAMLTSAPFDNWWHTAYGVDVKIVSPPHALLMLGVFSVSIGVLFLLLATMNRSAELRAGEEHSHKMLQRLFLYIGGLITGQQMFFLLEYTWDTKLHNVSAYIATAMAIPLVLAMLSQASRSRWAATWAAAIYTLFGIGEIWILPLFPAQPRLGPVFYPVAHMVPAKFPILILAPAFALDILWQRTRTWSTWKVALVSGAVFIAVLAGIEWPFANFLLSKASENRFFGTMYFDYSSIPASAERRRIFFQPSHGIALLDGLLRAAVYSAAGTWAGLRFGRWMKSIQR